MNEISNALVKAREKAGQTAAPFLLDPQAAQAAQRAKERLLRKAKYMRWFWVALSSIALLVVGFIIWAQLADYRKARLAPVPPVIAKEAEAKQSTQVGDAKVEVGAELTVSMQASVDGWIFAAVMPGENPRLMLDGRLIRVGDTVEADLVFAGIEGAELLFRDAAGAVYRRKY